MQRFPRTATNIIVALTALAWVIAVLLGKSEQAAYALGFIPLRLTGAAMPFAAVPAILTPLTATVAHSGLVHLGFNLLILLWCGSQVERVIGPVGLVIMYVIGAYAAAAAQWWVNPHGAMPMIGASGAISAVMGAFALSYGRLHAQPAGQPLDQRSLADGRVDRASNDDGLARQPAGLSARHAGACRRICRRAAASAPAAAVAVQESLNLPAAVGGGEGDRSAKLNGGGAALSP